MTGRPAETWRRFKFATPPDWAYALLILVCIGGLGFIALAVVTALVAQRASGFLPLTRSSNRMVALATRAPVALLIGGVVAWFAAGAIGLPTDDPTAGTIAGVLFWVGLFAVAAGIVGRLLVMPLVCPRSKVADLQPYQYDRLVELRNVHPVFVTAVNQMHANWAAQYGAQRGSPSLPQSN